MARRSLRSWAGVAHTETLSLAGAGLDAGQRRPHAEALAALERAHELGLRQGSDLFVSRGPGAARALHWAAGEAHAARDATQAARAHAGRGVTEPLRASALALMEVLVAADAAPVTETMARCPR